MHCSHQDLEESARTLLELRVILRFKNQHRSCQTSSEELNFACLAMDVWFLSALHDSINNWLSKFVYGCRAKDGCCTSHLSSTSFHMTRFTRSQFCGKIIAYEIRWACFGWNPIQYSMNMYWRSLVQIPSWSAHEDVHKYLYLHLAICCTSSGSKTHLRSYTMKQIGESERERESKFVVKVSVMIARIGLTIYLKNSLIFLSQKHLGWESWLFSFFLHLNFAQDSRTESSCLFLHGTLFWHLGALKGIMSDLRITMQRRRLQSHSTVSRKDSLLPSLDFKDF